MKKIKCNHWWVENRNKYFCLNCGEVRMVDSSLVLKWNFKKHIWEKLNEKN